MTCASTNLRTVGAIAALAFIHLVTVLGIGLGIPSSAQAASHLWRFSEFYSSPDRTIQFIEMQEIGGSSGEINIGNRWFHTDSYNVDMSDLLGSNLVGDTANKKFLVGTQSYAALPNVPTPDYVIPDGAINPSGDTIVWWLYQTKDIPLGTMPSDGILSISVIDPASPTSGFTVGVNSPTNFAGDTGSVMLAPQVPALGSGGRGLLLGLLVLFASLFFWRRRWRFAN